ncbi:MAG: 4Fe-4S binding protein [Myxococcales bacterium]|nr:4Fe-4S binding protein [Myxococcales bacterium]
MKPRLAFKVVLAGLAFLALSSRVAIAESPIDCVELGCSAVLPDAKRFETIDDNLFATGFDASDRVVGWAARSTDIVDIKAYSGKPLVTLVGISPKGIISGAKLLEHGEPILLVGIPESKLHDFIAYYVDLHATSRVVVGHSSDPEAIEVDMISGATVTALAQNQTILKTARTVGMATGAVSVAEMSPGKFIVEDRPWTWDEMAQAGTFGRLTVTEEELGIKNSEGILVDLFYTIADAPHIGRGLLGDLTYEHQMKKLEAGEHLFVVFGNGSGSFKGSAFVRGGIFDRVRFAQGLTDLTFRDTDYTNITINADGAPYFKEAAVFVSRGAQIDPGQKYELLFLGSRYTGAYEREFIEFKSSHKLPRSIYRAEKSNLDEPIYVQAWRNRMMDVWLLLGYLALVLGVFIFRRYSTRTLKWLMRIHVALMAVGFVLIGLHMHAQPSVTQVLTLIGTAVGSMDWQLFLVAPLIFILWIFIAVVSLIWGRGVFCGWVCPYGSMTELLNKIAIKLKVPQKELPKRLTYLRYVVLVVLGGVFLWDAALGEVMAEVEPFKSTFLVVPWERNWGFFGWWLFLFAASIFMWRPFCRFLCPLGAALAIFGSFRFSGPRRRNFCSSCKICTKTCEPHAFRKDGTIDPRECFSCMECEAVYRNDDKCPPLITIKKIESNPSPKEHDLVQLKKMKDARKDV